MHCYNKWGRRGVSVVGRRRRWWLNECICLAVMAWEQIDACSGCEVTCLFPPQPAKKCIREELNRTSEKCIRGRLRNCCENRPRDAGHVEISWKRILNFKHSQRLVYLFWNLRQQIFPHMKIEKRNILCVGIMPWPLLRLWLRTTLAAPFIRHQFNYLLHKELIGQSHHRLDVWRHAGVVKTTCWSLYDSNL